MVASLSVSTKDRPVRYFMAASAPELPADTKASPSPFLSRFKPTAMEVFAFASWQGGCGCTTLAMALGQELARFYRKRVLYLSLEAVESTPQYMPGRSGVKTAGEFLCHLLMPAQKQGLPFLEQYVISDDYGVEAFAPAAEPPAPST